MRRIAVINQKGGVGKTTTCANLGAALARAGKSVVLMDLDPQANLSLHLDQQEENAQATVYGVLSGRATIAQVLRPTRTPGLGIVPAHIDLSGAELELASAMGRELILRDAIDAWEASLAKSSAAAPDFLILDCPPSLGLLSVNGLVAAHETIVALQTEFFALQGMTKLLEVVGLLQRRLNPRLSVLGILPSLYDSRLKLAREVLAEIREHFPRQVFARPISKSVKLAECTSFGQTIFEYAPESSAAADYTALAQEILGAKASLEIPAPQAATVSSTASEKSAAPGKSVVTGKSVPSVSSATPASLDASGKSIVPAKSAVTSKLVAPLPSTAPVISVPPAKSVATRNSVPPGNSAAAVPKDSAVKPARLVPDQTHGVPVRPESAAASRAKVRQVAIEPPVSAAPVASDNAILKPAPRAELRSEPAKAAPEIAPVGQGPRSQRRPVRATTPQLKSVVVPAAPAPTASGASVAMPRTKPRAPVAPAASVPRVATHLEAPELD